jgi:hypothetical protein
MNGVHDMGGMQDTMARVTTIAGSPALEGLVVAIRWVVSQL